MKRFYWSLKPRGWHLALHTRTHSPDVIIGLLWASRNGVQVVAGPLAITVGWPLPKETAAIDRWYRLVRGGAQP